MSSLTSSRTSGKPIARVCVPIFSSFITRGDSRVIYCIAFQAVIPHFLTRRRLDNGHTQSCTRGAEGHLQRLDGVAFRACIAAHPCLASTSTCIRGASSERSERSNGSQPFLVEVRRPVNTPVDGGSYRPLVSALSRKREGHSECYSIPLILKSSMLPL